MQFVIWAKVYNAILEMRFTPDHLSQEKSHEPNATRAVPEVLHFCVHHDATSIA